MLYKQTELFRNIINENEAYLELIRNKNAPIFSPDHIKYIMKVKNLKKI